MHRVNDCYLRALQCKPVDRIPIWLMRQAGRYLPEYRMLRTQVHDFLTFCKTPELAVAASLQPIERFDLDAAILFSDILIIPEAMGLKLCFKAGEGPCFKGAINRWEDVEALHPIDDPSSQLPYLLSAVAGTKKSLAGRLPLIGFAGTPWTLGAYMVEGRRTNFFLKLRAMRYQAPELLHHLLKKLSASIAIALQAQVDAGVDAIVLFDSWGGLLSLPDYRSFSLHYIRHIIKSLHIRQAQEGRQPIPVTLFTKGADSSWLPAMATTGCAAISLDWSIPLDTAKRALLDQRVALQGNLDPAALYAPRESLELLVNTMMDSLGSANSGYIVNLGHGIPHDVEPEKIATFIDAARRYNAILRASK